MLGAKSTQGRLSLAGLNRYQSILLFSSRVRTFDQPHYRAKRRSAPKSKRDFTINKLKGFIENESEPGRNLSQTMSKYSKRDAKFSQFAETFNGNQEKTIKFGNILDFRTGDIPNVFAKSDELRKKELVTLDQYIRRDQQKDFRSKLEDLKVKLTGTGSKDENAADPDTEYMNPVHERLNSQIIGRHGEFTIILMNSDVTTNITRLYRPKKARVLLFGGNFDGVIGWGMGTGKNYQVAVGNAKRALLRNLIAINLDHMVACPVALEGKFNGIQMHITPNKGFNSWGNPLVAWFCRLAGLDNCRFRVIGQSSNRYTLVKAFFETVTQNQTPMTLAEAGAIHRQRLIYGTELSDKKQTTPIIKTTNKDWWNVKKY